MSFTRLIGIAHLAKVIGALQTLVLSNRTFPSAVSLRNVCTPIEDRGATDLKGQQKVTEPKVPFSSPMFGRKVSLPPIASLTFVVLATSSTLETGDWFA